MSAVNYRDGVIYPAARELGLDPELDLQRNHAAALSSSANKWTRRGWESWIWPELELTEERAFREVWSDEVAYLRQNGEGDPDEFFYIVSLGPPTSGTYYRVKATAPSDPPAGTLPTDATYFEELPAPVDAYVGLDQRGKQSIGIIRGVYKTDPRLSRACRWPYGLSEFGIDVPLCAGPTVWIHYQVKPSRFTHILWDEETAWKRNDLVFDPDSGECFRALAGNTDQPPAAHPELWMLQPMPYFLAEYVKLGMASDNSTDLQTKADFRAQAEEALTREIDKLKEQGQVGPSYSLGSTRSGIWKNLSTGAVVSQ